jgi:hypothetical protein
MDSSAALDYIARHLPVFDSGPGASTMQARLASVARRRSVRRGLKPPGQRSRIWPLSLLVQQDRDGELVNPVHLAIKGNEVWVPSRHRTIYIFDLEGKYCEYQPGGKGFVWTHLLGSVERRAA